jgi:hypothetical protein
MVDGLAVRTLVERLLSLPHHSDAEAEPVRVLAGALPDDLPCAVPIRLRGRGMARGQLSVGS